MTYAKDFQVEESGHLCLTCAHLCSFGRPCYLQWMEAWPGRAVLLSAVLLPGLAVKSCESNRLTKSWRRSRMAGLRLPPSAPHRRAACFGLALNPHGLGGKPDVGLLRWFKGTHLRLIIDQVEKMHVNAYQRPCVSSSPAIYDMANCFAHQVSILSHHPFLVSSP